MGRSTSVSLPWNKLNIALRKHNQHAPTTLYLLSGRPASSLTPSLTMGSSCTPSAYRNIGGRDSNNFVSEPLPYDGSFGSASGQPKIVPLSNEYIIVNMDFTLTFRSSLKWPNHLICYGTEPRRTRRSWRYKLDVINGHNIECIIATWLTNKLSRMPSQIRHWTLSRVLLRAHNLQITESY